MKLYIYSFIAAVAIVLSYLFFFQDSGLNVILTDQSEEISDKLQVSYHIKEGDTFSKVLSDIGIQSSDQEVWRRALLTQMDLNSLSLGQQLDFTFSKQIDSESGETEYKFEKMIIHLTYAKKLVIIDMDNGDLLVDKKIIPFKKTLVKVGGPIKSSLYQTAADLEIPQNSLADLVKNLSYDVDFQRELKTNANFSVIFEKYYTEDGVYSHSGNIIYANLELTDRDIQLYRYADGKGNADYFDQHGNSVRKDLIRTPINAARISSKFGQRKHPVLGYTKMHKGIDFAAPTGTPIYAAGKGVIEEIGVKGAYGNYIRIKHTSEYATAYAHVKKFAPSLKRGSYVKQGQVIAYVGTTGRSTGPHLHYEVLQNNQQINPLNAKMRPGYKIPKREILEYANFVKDVDELIYVQKDKPEISYENVSKRIKIHL